MSISHAHSVDLQPDPSSRHGYWSSSARRAGRSTASHALSLAPVENPLARWIHRALQDERERAVAQAREQMRLEQARARFAAD